MLTSKVTKRNCKQKFNLLLLIFTLTIPFRMVHSQTEDDELPKDMLLSVGSQIAAYQFHFNTLAVVDRESRQIKSQHIFENVSAIFPKSWSPQGNLLAVLVVRPTIGVFEPTYRQVCLIDMTDNSENCLEAPLTLAGYPEEHLITWSRDGSRVYYVSSEPDKPNERNLIELDIQTGKILRTIYTLPDEEKLVITISWSDKLNYLLTNVGEGGNDAFSNELINLQTGEKISLEKQLPSGMILETVCNTFSPNGNYFLVKIFNTPTDSSATISRFLALFDTSGTLISLVGTDTQYSSIGLSCPVWRQDEKAFYLMGGVEESKFFIYQYLVSENELNPIYEWDDTSEVFPTRLNSIFTDSDGNDFLSLQLVKKKAIAILYPNHVLEVIDTSDEIISNSMWIP